MTSIFSELAQTGVSLDNAFHPISTDVRPVQSIEGFSDGDAAEAALRAKTMNELASNASSAYVSTASIYTRDSEGKYAESNIKKSVDYVPDKNDQINLEYKQRMDQYNMLMGASIITGLSITVLLGMILAKSV